MSEPGTKSEVDRASVDNSEFTSALADTGMGVFAAPFRGVEARLITTVEREGLDKYLAAGGYTDLVDVDGLLSALDAAGVRGRGGAAFPLARKARTVASGSGTTVLVANGEEGEPASVKDRWLMRHRPHLVLDGVRLAAEMINAQDVYLYVSDPASALSLRNALVELAEAQVIPLLAQADIHQVKGAYVAGEETAAVRSINGGPALPQDKPPRPFESGVMDRPTMISNVETLANIPYVHRYGAERYRSVGTVDSPGTFLLTLTGTAHDGLYEVPFGITLRELLLWLEDNTPVDGALVGGYFAGVLAEHVLDLPLEYSALSAAGSGLGCGAIAVIDEATCPIAVSASVLGYFDRENAGQCGSCFNGTAAMASAMSALSMGIAEPTDVKRLRGWSQTLRGRGACGTLDGAANVAAGVLREFPKLVENHINSACKKCSRKGAIALRPFAVLDAEGRSLK